MRTFVLGRRAVLTGSLAVWALGAFQPAPAAAQDGEAAVRVPKYKPMNRGAPGARIGGATRGAPPETLKMIALAPDHVAYAASPSPKLYWFLSAPISQASFTLKVRDGAEVATKSLAGDFGAGLHAVDLAGHGLTLEPETVYEWSVGLPGDRPQDIAAPSRGLLAFRAPSAKLIKQIEKADAAEAVGLYAGQGYWYDAVAEVSRLAADDPSNATNRQIRAGLAEQAKLYDVVDFDRAAAE